MRQWCSSCVRGRARADAHRALSEEQKAEEQLPTISIDYGFLGSEGTVQRDSIGSNSLPILIVKDRLSRCIWARPTPQKGTANPYAGAEIVRILDSTGYKRLVLKTDQEPAIVALAREVKHGWTGEIVPEASPKYTSPSNGEVERAVQEVQGLARTLKDQVEQRAKMKLEGSMNLMTWLVSWIIASGAHHKPEESTPHPRTVILS